MRLKKNYGSKKIYEEKLSQSYYFLHNFYILYKVFLYTVYTLKDRTSTIKNS